MKTFSEAEIKKYLEYVDENMAEIEDMIGACFICGRELGDVELPEGPEKKVVCLKDRDYFVESYEELQEMGEIK